ncbi:MAG: acetolactate decarboxylase [Thermoguttaceae bacterium]
MPKSYLKIILASVILFSSGWFLCNAEEPFSSEKDKGITQIATIDSLLAGVYDGETTLAELGRLGNFGIGTFDQLDGEMTFIDGVFFQIKSDGKVYKPTLDTKTPFASVVPAERAKTEKFKLETSLNFEELCKKIDELAPNKNVPVLVLLSGKFSGVKTRSVPAQQKPYRPLAEVTKTQPEFELGTIEGDVVGFRLPEYMKGMNVPGYHIHFLSKDRKSGGHILNLKMDSGLIELAAIHSFQVILPTSVDDFSAADLAKDRSEELKKVEQQSKKEIAE